MAILSSNLILKISKKNYMTFEQFRQDRVENGKSGDAGDSVKSDDSGESGDFGDSGETCETGDSSEYGYSDKSAYSGKSYLIFVTCTTGGACVKNSVRCKIFQIERKKLHILHFLGLFVVIFGCFS